MKIYFIRHGQTVCNAAGTHQGWGPIGLSEKGFMQAAKAHEYLADVKFDKYHASDLLRTRQTAEVIFPDEYHEGRISFEEDIREIDTGAFFGKTADEMKALFGDEYMRRRLKMQYGIFGGEDVVHLCRRVGRFMKTLENEVIELKESDSAVHKKIAVVAHGGIIRAFTSIVVALEGCRSLDEIDYANLPYAPFNASNCSISSFDFKSGRGWYIDQLNINTQSE
ncbi:MAG: histidine phosphatase family protein [Clostridiales bacterium]|nr:histidine phosphatase family protein [Clostridiales bacterium]